MIRLIFLVVVSLCFMSCNRNASNNVPSDYSQSDCKKNVSGNYLLCVKTNEVTKNEIPSVSYSILKKDGELIHKGVISRGTVTWLDDKAIQIYEVPGNVSTDLTENDITRVYLVLEGEVMSKTDYLKLN